MRDTLRMLVAFAFLVSCGALFASQERVKPITGYEAAKRVVNLALGMCWDEHARFQSVEPEMDVYLRCIRVKLDESLLLREVKPGDLTKDESGNLIKDKP